jgi:hypothetical protein
MQESQLPPWLDRDHTDPGNGSAPRCDRLGPLSGQLGEELVDRDPDRAGQLLFVQNPAPDVGGDLLRSPMEPSRSGKVQKSLVQREGLDQGREIAKNLEDPGADLAVASVIAWEKDRIRAELAGPGRSHRREHSIGTSFLGGRGDNPTAARATHNDRLTPQLRSAVEFDRHEECIHINMADVGVRVTHSRSTTSPSDPVVTE